MMPPPNFLRLKLPLKKDGRIKIIGADRRCIGFYLTTLRGSNKNHKRNHDVSALKKGSGVSLGFDCISDTGRILQESTKEENAESVREQTAVFTEGGDLECGAYFLGSGNKSA